MDPPKEQSHEDVDVLRRLRVLEDRFVNLRRKAQLADEKVLGAEAKLNTELKALSQELVQIRRSIADLRESVQIIQGEMVHTATQHDLRTIEKYLDYWQPMDFVTKQELLAKHNLLKERNGKT